MLLDGVILTGSISIQTNRSRAAIYNILIGTKAIQTVLDVHLYRLQRLYGIYPSLLRKEFDEHVDKLIHTGHLFLIEQNKLQITDKGKKHLQSCEKLWPFQYFNGIKYARLSSSFIERLLLAIQTFTNKQAGSSRFIPVIDKPEVYKWVKAFYNKHRRDTKMILTGLFTELSQLLQKVPNMEASLFVDRLTGFNRYGRTFHQLHKKYAIHHIDVKLYLEAITHKLLSEVHYHKDTYHILHKFIQDFSPPHFLTTSANHTFDMYKKGIKAHEIALVRNLKLNTIYDHLVEIALYDPVFPYSDYVDQTEAASILWAIEATSSFKLKDIKSLMDQHITYFQIRLVLTQITKSS